MTRLVFISDTHDHDLDEIGIPEGDILIHCGDATSMGTVNQIARFNFMLGKLPHKHKIIIAGNHDWLFQQSPEMAKIMITNAIYLENSSVIVEGIKFWGSPATPFFHDWAFNYDRASEDLYRIWSRIPEDTDVLITHGPPLGIGDITYRGEQVGCYDLFHRVRVVKPKIHVFGHIHYSYGDHGLSLGTRFINASTCDERYQPTNKPIVIDYEE